MTAYLVFNYDNKVVDKVHGITASLPPRNPNYGFKEEWVTLRGAIFGERAVWGVGYYKKKGLDWVPTLFFAEINDQFEVRAEGKPVVLDTRLAIKG